jgi:hypothetical protein
MKSVTCARVAASPSYDTAPSSLSCAFHHSKYGGGSNAFSLSGICASFSGVQRCSPSRKRNSHSSPSDEAKLLNSHICLRRLPLDMRNEWKQAMRTILAESVLLACAAFVGSRRGFSRANFFLPAAGTQRIDRIRDKIVEIRFRGPTKPN